MASDSLKWIDSDMHLAEPVDLWREYLEPAYRDAMPKWMGGKGNYLREPARWSIGGKPPAPTTPNDPFELNSARKWAVEPYLSADGSYIDAAGQLRGMETEAIDVAVLFPTNGNRGWQDPALPPDVNLALARAYNSWLHDFVQEDPSRLKMNALIPMLDVDGAVKEIRRAAEKLGAISISPGSTRSDIRLDDPKWDPIWAEAEGLGVTVAFHGGRNVHLAARYRDNQLLSHISGRGIEHPVGFMELLVGGVFERHPRMRCAFLEAGCSWLLYWLFRIEEEWDRFRAAIPTFAENVKILPRDYWRRQCWVAVEAYEWTLPAVVQMLGDENFVISSDFPHGDAPFPETRGRLMSIEGLSLESKRKILWDNCAHLYGLS